MSIHEPPSPTGIEQRGPITTRAEACQLLGISPNASPLVAQAMYWARVKELRQAEAAGDEDARVELDILNGALSLLLDPMGRGTTSANAIDASNRASSWKRRLSTFAWTAGTLAVVTAGAFLIALMAPQGLAMLAVLPVALGVFLLWRRSHPPKPSPFATLQLTDDAEVDEIDLAYRTIASAWLARLREDPAGTVRALESLDSAYASAMSERLHTRSGGRAWQHTARRVAVAAGLAAAQALVRFALWATAQITRGATALAVVLVPAAARTVRERIEEHTQARSVQPDVEAAVAVRRRAGAPVARQIAVDLERRLSASVHELARDATPEVEAAVPAADRFRIVLQTGAGQRRVPVGARPLRLGTAPDCDLVLPTQPGSEPVEQALVWTSGDDLVLHANALANCLVNDQPASWARLEHGDRFTIGGTTFLVEEPTGAEA